MLVATMHPACAEKEIWEHVIGQETQVATARELVVGRGKKSCSWRSSSELVVVAGGETHEAVCCSICSA